MRIDTSYDVRTDAGGRDPDSHSATLRRYHKLLWSKKLPCGRLFELEEKVNGAYLYHQSELGTFSLSSDSVVPSFTRWKSLKHIIDQVPEEENEAFRTVGSTIGSTMIFPGNRIDGKATINGARGFTRKIAYRFDLTLECIRRHYQDEASPLGGTLARYRDFFALFQDFERYVDFFVLQDLVGADGSAIKFFMPFDDFNTPSVPSSVEEYVGYRQLSIAFVRARNLRIDRQIDS